MRRSVKSGYSSSDASSYDHAAPRWGDKMRTLGYCDAYLGFLAAYRTNSEQAIHVVDIGAGTAAFAEAWIAVNGQPGRLTLLDPSRAMLDRGAAALGELGEKPVLLQGMLGEIAIEPAHEALAAHILEHCPDPAVALTQIRDALQPEGRLYLVVSKPHWCNAIIWLQWRHRTFARDEIVSLLQEAGFRVEGVHMFASGPPSRTSLGICATRLD